MKTIRHNVFETNSSSEHVFAIAQNENEYKAFLNNEMYIDRYEQNLVTIENVFEKFKEDRKKEGRELPDDLTFEIFKFIFKHSKEYNTFYICNKPVKDFNQYYSYNELTDLSGNWTNTNSDCHPGSKYYDSYIRKDPKNPGKYEINACWYNG